MPLPNSPGASSTSSSLSATLTTTTPPPHNMSSSVRHSPTLAPPTNARGTPRRPPKLRSSCDACGAAKVRCDKTQPRCGRCVAGGLNCVYGLSRKFGKAPRKKPPVDTNISTETIPRPLAQNAQQNSISCCPDFRHMSGGITTTTPITTTSSSSSSSSSSRPMKYEPTPISSNFGLDDNLMAMTGGYPSHDMFLRSPTSMDTFEDHFSFSDGPTSSSSSSLGIDHRGTVDPLDLTFPSSDFQSYAEWVQTDDLMHSPATSQDADTTTTSPSLLSRTSSIDSLSGYPEAILMAADAHNCNKLAYSTLESLSCRQETLMANPKGGEPLTQTMDKVLNRNKQAVHNMHQLLKCSCSKSPHLAMLYASITSKILMWYQLAAGCTRPTTTSSWDYFSSSTSSSFLGNNTMNMNINNSHHNQHHHNQHQHHQPTPPLSASSSPSMAFVQPGSPIVAQTNQFVVTPMQFSVGAFSVDDESAQEALRKQLLLSELKKAGNLIDLLSIHGRDELATGEVNDIYSALGTWLKCELNRTIASLKS